MKKRRWIFLAFTVCFVMWAGCAKEEKQENVAKKERSSAVDRMRMQVKEEGVFYLDGYTTLMTFYDYNMAESMPVCDKPNCGHDSLKCNAFVESGYQSAAAYYRGKLYFFDIADPEYVLYESDANGDNRKELAKLNKGQKHGGCSLELPLYFREDKLYAGVQYMDFLSEPVRLEDGTMQNTKEAWQIVEISLTDGSVKSMKEPEEIKTADFFVSFEAYWEDSVLFFRNQEAYLYNMKTKEETLLYSGTDARYYISADIERGTLYYFEETEQYAEVFEVDLRTAKTASVLKKERGGKQSYWQYWDGTLYYSLHDESENSEDGVLGSYEMSEKKETELSKEEYLHIPQYEAGDWYVFWTEEGAACIKKEDYKKKDWKKTQVIGRF